eukprot:TRINITY_DN1400_c1_g2_i1.p1 TRINITY_DN1400_c1_g2~~TRINITY_DN1400_c1_g2_i1.p1  ORF type:complete len:792 (-),score=102.54 TRINITY_DN1400_c1_g2_i1:6712-9087(-)
MTSSFESVGLQQSNLSLQCALQSSTEISRLFHSRCVRDHIIAAPKSRADRLLQSRSAQVTLASVASLQTVCVGKSRSGNGSHSVSPLRSHSPSPSATSFSWSCVTYVMSASLGEQLITAARNGDTSSVLGLLEQNVDVNHQGAMGFTALLRAARGGHVNVVNLLLQREANVHHVNDRNRTALHQAAGFGRQQIVQALLRAGAQVNHADHDGYTPLRNAACYGHLSITKMLIEAGADINCVDKRGLSPLMIAARQHRPHVVRSLIDCGAQLEISDCCGRTALFTHHLACVDSLCQAHANVNHVDHDGDTPLTYAVRHADSSVVKRLLDAGANPYHLDSYGANALILAAACGNEATVKVLIAANVDVNRVNQQQSTALMWAARHTQTAIVRVLLNAGARVNVIDKHGSTALHYALDRCVIHRCHDVASVLVEHGADLLIANDNNDSPLSLLPNASGLRRTLLDHFDDDVDKMWHRFVMGAQSTVTTEQLLDVLCSGIRSLCSLLAAHNLLLLLVRTDQFTKQELHCLRGSPGFLLQNVYLAVSRLRLSKQEHIVASVVTRHAEDVGFIPECSAVWVNHAIEVRSEIRENRLLLQVVMEKVLDDICSLHQRVYRLEEWTQQAADEFQRLAQNNEQMVNDMKQMCHNLNDLHTNLRQQQRRLIYTAIARTVLSIVPVFGKAFCDATYAGIELFCRLTTEDMVEIGTDIVKGSVSLGFALDMSDPKYVRKLTSVAFLPQLEPIAKKRLEFVVAQSNFKSVEALHRELETVERMAMENLTVDGPDKGGSEFAFTPQT